ncbi:MAG: DinB family protein [Gemmatimonadaceae bacterium]|nr:DinB family protein [Gemmatimonadaceae bacterium]
MPASIVERPAVDEFASYYGRYIGLLPDGDLISIADKQIDELTVLLAPLTSSQWRHRYAPGKWSVLEVLGHLIDTERVFAYRAMAFSRHDPAPLPAFDQAAWIPHGAYDARQPAEVLVEWIATRRASIAFMRGLPAHALASRGVASGLTFSVLAALCVPVGHVNYHVQRLHHDYWGHR